jgi:hypothetical protein
VASAKLAALQKTAEAAVPTSGLSRHVLEVQTHCLFNALVNFVRDPDGLPDPIINSLGRQMRRSTATLRTPVILDPTYLLPSMVFAVSSKERDATSGLLLPLHFADMIREDLHLQITTMVYVASQIRDFREGRFPIDDQTAIETRAHAYEAQGLRALMSVLRAEGQVVQLVGYHDALLGEFPEGLASMPSELVYGQELAT